MTRQVRAGERKQPGYRNADGETEKQRRCKKLLGLLTLFGTKPLRKFARNHQRERTAEDQGWRNAGGDEPRNSERRNAEMPDDKWQDQQIQPDADQKRRGIPGRSLPTIGSRFSYYVFNRFLPMPPTGHR